MLPFAAVYVAYTFLNLLKGKWSHFRALLSVRAVNRLRRRELGKMKNQVKNIRRITDHALLKQVM